MNSTKMVCCNYLNTLEIGKCCNLQLKKQSKYIFVGIILFNIPHGVINVQQTSQTRTLYSRHRTNKYSFVFGLHKA